MQAKSKILEKKEKSRKMELTDKYNVYKKDYSSFNIIRDARNTIKTESIISNSITDKSVNYDKLLLENNNKLFSSLKIFNLLKL